MKETQITRKKDDFLIMQDQEREKEFIVYILFRRGLRTFVYLGKFCFTS